MKLIKYIFYKYKKELLISLISAGAILYIINHFFFYYAVIPSESMCNTLYVGDRIFVSKNIYPLQKGNIYTFYHDKTLMIKRLIGTGGDKIKIEGDLVYVNDIKLNEPYVSSSMLPATNLNLEFIVPDGKYFFMGDNRGCSIDSRFWNDPYVNEDDIDGRALKVVWPEKHKADL